METEILRRITPDVPVTTNFMGFFKPADYRKWAHQEDVVCLTPTPTLLTPLPRGKTPQCAIPPARWATAAVMLISTVERRQLAVATLKQPGQMRLWSMQALACAAPTPSQFFQWRAAFAAGAEKVPRRARAACGRRIRAPGEVSVLGNELQELGPAGAAAPWPMPVSLSTGRAGGRSNWTRSPPTAVTFYDRLASFYGPLFAANITADFVLPTATLPPTK